MSAFNNSAIQWCLVGDEWQRHEIEATQIFQCSSPDIRANIIFLSSLSTANLEAIKARVPSLYGINPQFWSKASRRSNGFFNCENFPHNDRIGHRTWFRFSAKRISRDGRNYQWQEIDFYTSFIPEKSATLLCFGLPLGMQSAMNGSTWLSSIQDVVSGPYIWHCHLLGYVLELYEEAIWEMRGVVRSIEKHRDRSSKPDFFLLHDNARHALHSNELLTVAESQIRAMIRQNELLFQFGPDECYKNTVTLQFTQQRLYAYAEALLSLRSRSEATYARLNNEISLAFNLVSQQDSQANIRLSDAAVADSRAMRKIAFLTLLFFPATFVSALFSTTFFDFRVADGISSVSSNFWIYWAVVVPLTGLVYIIWHFTKPN